jgi:hypothetical protein
MRRRFVSVCILALAGITILCISRSPRRQTREFFHDAQFRSVGSRASSHTPSGRAASLSIPMTFEPNVGQAKSSVKFVGRGAGMTLLLTSSGMDVEVPQLRKAHGQSGVAAVQVRAEWSYRREAETRHRQVMPRSGGYKSLRFVWRGERRLKTVSNYFIGSNRRDWRADVPHFARAMAASDSGEQLGIAVYGTNAGVEYDLRLAPGTDASKLRLRFSGTSRVELADGNVAVQAGNRELRMAKPRIYAALPNGYREPVRGSYMLGADGSVGVQIGPYDPRATLVIDPSLSVTYATFLGGTGNETAANVAMDANGKIYIGGVTSSSSTFPELSGSAIGPALGNSAFYVAKIDPTVTGANSLVYLTFIGGSGTQSGGLIAVDGAGDVALTGTTTSTDYPVAASSKPTTGLTSGSGNDAVVSELSPQGNQLNFSAYFGGSGKESANGAGGIAVDRAGNVYIASDTEPGAADPASPDLPVTAGALQPNWDGERSDGFLAVFAPPAQAGVAPTLTYCTYLGTNSTGDVIIGGVTVDSSANAYVAGSTSNEANGFPLLKAFQGTYGGGSSDGFVMKIRPKGQGSADLVYATLLGGSGMDEVLGIGLDSSLAPKVYVTGETQSPDFPVTAGAYQSKLTASPVVSGSGNAFLAVIAQDPVSAQTSLSYSTYLGGSGADQGLSIAVAAPASVYISGQTNSANFPWRDNMQPFNGAADAFLTKLDPTSSGAASLLYGTPLAGTSPPGGNATAAATGVVASGAGQVYVTGQTTAADFPTAVTTAAAINGFQQSCASCQNAQASSDTFLLAIAESSTAEPSVYFNAGSENFGSASLGSSITGQPLAVLNGGEASLTISNIEVLGPNAGDFSMIGESACIGTAISPGPTPLCSLDATFTPSAGGAEVAFLAVTDNAPGSPQLLELKGTGDAPHAQVLPASLNFGNQPAGSQSASQTATIANTGNQNLVLTGEVISPLAAPFEPQGGSCQFPAAGWALAPGASCTVQIAFVPTATGPAQAQLQISDNSDLQSSAQQVIALSGTGATPAPMAQITPAALTFGSTLVGSTSAPQSVTLENSGSAALAIDGMSIGGTNSADFQIVSTGTTCPTTSGSIATGAQCAVAVQFAPQTSGATKAASLNFADNAPMSPQSVALSGSATSPASLTVSPGYLDFGSQSQGTTSAAQLVTITNGGSGSAGISGITIVGSSDFSQQNACPPVLAAGAQCQVSVTFAPAESAAPGARSGSLKIPGGAPATVSLSGTATQAAISFTTSLNFASQLVGTAGAPQPITVTNSSSGSLAGALAFTGISITGANKSDFAVSSNQCQGSNSAISPGGSCTVQVAFQPQSAQTCGDTPTRTASLQLQDNAPGSPQIVALSGSAADFCMASANGQPVTTPIQAGQTASYALEVASSGGFTGTVNLSCSAPVGDEIGPCEIGANPASNPPSVQVTPSAAGQFTVSVPTVAPAAILPRSKQRSDALSLRTLAIGGAWMLLLWFTWSGDPLGARTRTMRAVQVAALMLTFGLAIAGCGSSGGNDPAADPGTPPGTYTISVTATATNGGTSTTRTASLTLTVQ